MNDDLPLGPSLPNWTPSRVPPLDAMIGRFCRLVPLDPDQHSDALFQAFSQNDENQGSWTYLPYGPFDRFGHFDNWLRDTCLGSDPHFHTIMDVATERPVGLASYLRIEPSSGVIEVGHIHYSPLLQRTPAATEAMYLMMKRVFDELGYRRYEWKCDALNAKSRRATERLGFQFEGLFRQAAIYKGRNRDTSWYSIIDEEWPQRRAAFEQWLSPENFDSHGLQKHALETFR